MARKIIGDQLRYGDIEAAYSEPNYLGRGIGLLGATIHNLFNENKEEAKVEGKPSTDAELATRQSMMKDDLRDANNSLRALQNRNTSETDKAASAVNDILGQTDFGGIQIKDFTYKDLFGKVNTQQGYDSTIKTENLNSLDPSAYLDSGLILKSAGALLGGPLFRLTTGQPRANTSGRMTTGQRRTTSRMAPQSYMTGSNVRVDEEQEMQPLSFLGQEGAAFVEGYNVGIKKRNYARRVWEQQQQDLDDAFGDVKVAPSGNTAYDSSIEQVSEEKVNEMAQLMSQRGKMKPSEFTKKYNELKNWTEQMNLGSKAVIGLIQDYAKDKDLVSAGTKPEVVDVIDTLYKGGGDLTVKNINGVTTLVGTANSGADVSIPISDLAGSNKLRYLKKVNTENFYNSVLNGDGKTKGILDNKTWMTNGMTAQQKLMAYDGAIGTAVQSQVEQFLDNPGTIRAIAAERLGMPYDAFENRFRGDMDTAKDFVSDYLQDQIKQRYAVKAGITYQLKKDPGYPEPDTGGDKPKDYTDLNKKFSNPNFLNSFNNPDGLDPGALSMIIGGPAMIDKNDDNFIIIKNPRNNRELKINRKNREETLRILAKEVYDVNLSDLTITETKASGQGPRSAQEIYDQYVKLKNNI
jgi:hypothetical protein